MARWVNGDGASSVADAAKGIAVESDSSDELRGSLRVATVSRVAKLEPYRGFLTETALRALIFDAEDRFSASGHRLPGNGLATAILRVGRKVLIDLNEFDSWLMSRRSSIKQPKRNGVK